MSLRILELFFRHKLMLVAPLFLGALLGIAWAVLTYTSDFRSRATVWVDRPTDINGAVSTEFSPYVSPAQNQAMSMNELLATRSFLTAVAKKVDNAADPPDWRLTQLRQNTQASAFGSHVLYVEYRAADPDEAAVTSKAIIDVMSKTYSNQIMAKAAQAATYYKEQADVARVAYETASADLQEYIRTRPQLANLQLTSQTPNTLSDPTLGRLLQAQETSKTNFDRVYDRLTESSIAATSSNAASSYFYIVDEPRVPQFPSVPTKKALLVKPVTGLGLGIFISGLIYLVLWRFDRKVRFASDLTFAGEGIPVVSLPLLETKRRWPSTFVRLASALQAGIINP